MTTPHEAVLRDLWNGDIVVTPEQRRWIRQALDAQDAQDAKVKMANPRAAAQSALTSALKTLPQSQLETLLEWADGDDQFVDQFIATCAQLGGIEVQHD